MAVRSPADRVTNAIRVSMCGLAFAIITKTGSAGKVPQMPDVRW